MIEPEYGKTQTCEDSARICARVRIICATTRPTCESCAGSARNASVDDDDDDADDANVADVADADAE